MNSKNKIEISYKLCTKCNFFCSMNELDEYCSLCGSKLIDVCPSCEREISNPYAHFCKYCGSAYPGKENMEKRAEEF